MWRPFVPFGAQFSCQLCSRVTPLLPALPEIALVRINETGSWSFPVRVGDGSRREPPLNRALAHPQRPRDLAALHPLSLQSQDAFIPSRSLGSLGLLHLLNGLRLGRTLFVGTMQLGKRQGSLYRDTGGQVLAAFASGRSPGALVERLCESPQHIPRSHRIFLPQ